MKFVKGCLMTMGGLVVFLIVLGVLAGLTHDQKTAAASKPAEAKSTGGASQAEGPSEELALQPGWTVTREELGIVKIRGKVVNNTGRDLGYAQIQFNCYDGSGALVDSALANINNLEAGGAWKFEAVALKGEHVKTAKLAKLTGF